MNQNAYDALVLAGDRKASRNVKGENRAFLNLLGRPVVQHVVSALLNARSVRDIYVIGPRDRLQYALSSVDASSVKGQGLGKRVHILEQYESLFENVRNGFLATIPEYSAGARLEDLSMSSREKCILIVSVDIPLLTPWEIDEFISKTDPERYDYELGLTEESVLSYYYPSPERRGIHHAYFHLREGSFRQNNMHFGCFFKVANTVYIEKMYEFRHQKEFLDILRLAYTILRSQERIGRTLRYFCLFQAARISERLGLGWAVRSLRKNLPIANVERIIGSLLGTRFRAVCTSYGGAALDIDSYSEFISISENYEAWMEHQRRLLSGGSITP